jgi:hypothetical protein
METVTITQETADNISALLFERTNNDHYRGVRLHLDWADLQLEKIKDAADDSLYLRINNDLNKLRTLVCKAIDSEAEACNENT